MTTVKKATAVTTATKAVAAPARARSSTARATTRSASKQPVKAVASVTKPAAKETKPVVQPQGSPAVKPKAEKPVKAKKPKLVRDSFTVPKDEYAVMASLKERAGQLSNPVKKSELLRAGIKALAAMPDAAFLAALKVVPSIKTGRPAKG